MQVARIHGVGDVRLHDEPRPSPASGESLVRVTAVGLCGSDLHWYADGGIGDSRLTRPLVAGHEFAGVVEGGDLAGRRVAVDPAIPCERCVMCCKGWYNLCLALSFAGHGDRDGALQEYVSWPTRLLHPLPETLSDADGAMLEPLGVALHALDLGHVHLGSRVAVVGCGPIGLLLLQVLRAAGATRIVAVEPLPHRRDAATRLGADVVLGPDELARDTTALSDAVGGIGADVTFEVAGDDDAVRLALEAAAPGGRVVLAGIPSDDRTTFLASLARRKGLTLALVRRMNEIYPRAIDLVASGRVDVASLVTHQVGLDRVDEAFATAQDRKGLKVVVTPAGSAGSAGSGAGA